MITVVLFVFSFGPPVRADMVEDCVQGRLDRHESSPEVRGYRLTDAGRLKIQEAEV